jgi:hypothetical protein
MSSYAISFGGFTIDGDRDASDLAGEIFDEISGRLRPPI